MKILVLHTGYGCDTGCCGHAIEVEDLAPGETRPGGLGFCFDHPYGQDACEFAQELVAKECGEEHVRDLDWEKCVILSGDGC